MKIGITGHRPHLLHGGFYAKTTHFHQEKIEKALLDVIEEELGWRAYFCDITGEVEGLTGMAAGTDQWFADSCNKIGIPFTAYIPCKNQDKLWPERAQMEYRNLLRSARKVIYTSDEEFTPGCLHKRNEAIVKDCDILIAYYDGRKKGGTYDAIKKADKYGKRIIIVNPYDGEE